MPDLSSAAQFWMNWWVQLAVAVGTVGAVFVALFGQGFRAKFFPPKLSLSLPNPDGEKAKVRLTWMENNVEQKRLADGRYYRLLVSNGRRWSPANQVQVVLIRVEELTADGQFAVSWAGNLPLTWMHQQLFPPLRTIGPASEIDLCSVVKDKWLELHPLIVPFDLQARHRQATRLILWVQVKSSECDSPVLRVQVSWDGQWHDGAQEMRRHLVLKVIDDAVA